MQADDFTGSEAKNGVPKWCALGRGLQRPRDVVDDLDGSIVDRQKDVTWSEPLQVGRRPLGDFGRDDTLRAGHPQNAVLHFVERSGLRL